MVSALRVQIGAAKDLNAANNILDVLLAPGCGDDDLFDLTIAPRLRLCFRFRNCNGGD